MPAILAAYTRGNLGNLFLVSIIHVYISVGDIRSNDICRTVKPQIDL